GSVGGAAGVDLELSGSSGRAVVAGRVSVERFSTDGRVVAAGVVNESVVAQECTCGVEVAAFSTSRSRQRQSRKPCQGEGDENKTAPQTRATDEICTGQNFNQNRSR